MTPKGAHHKDASQENVSVGFPLVLLSLVVWNSY